MPFTSDRFRLPSPVTKDASGGGARSMPDDPQLGTDLDDLDDDGGDFGSDEGGDGMDGEDLQATPDMEKRVSRRAVSTDTRDLIVNGEKIMTQLTPSGLQKLMSWGNQSRGEGPLPSQYQDSPGNTAGPSSPSGPARHPATGQYSSLANMLAQGHQAASVPGSQRLDFQQVMPTALASLSTAQGDPHLNPLASSIACHQGSATVQQIDQASASQPHLMSQLGQNAPSGNPSRPPFSGGNQPTPSQPLTPPSVYPSPACKSAVPGSQLTTRIASNGD